VASRLGIPATIALLFLFSILISVVSVARAFSNGQCASVVLGQTDFSGNKAGLSQTTLNAPAGVAVGASGDVWVSDTGNGRVLRFNSPLFNGEAASLVIGTPDFTSKGQGYSTQSTFELSYPYGLAFDAGNNLWVADGQTGRIMKFSAPFTTFENASIVIGPSVYFNGILGSGLQSPTEIAFDSGGNLWVVDTNNGRILRFNAPLSSGEQASLVIGKQNLTDSGVASLTASYLVEPRGLAFDATGNLWVSDVLQNRVLEFKSPFASGESASVVLGQPDFTTNTAAGDSSKSLSGPESIAFDRLGNLWIADGQYRVVEFSPPFSNFEAASLVLGSASLSGGSVFASGQSALHYPTGLAFGADGTLWVTSGGSGLIGTDNRVVGFHSSGWSCLPASLQANSTAGGTVHFQVSGNVSTLQVLSTSYGQSTTTGKADNLSLTVTGQSSTTGNITLTIPRASVSAGSAPLVTVNGISTPSATASDATYWYITFTLKFSTDRVFVQFASYPSSGSTTTSATTSSASGLSTASTSSSAQTSSGSGQIPEFPFQIVAATVFVALITVSYVVARRRTLPAARN
jgi:sugar lactone lactonase YvrE